MNYLSKSSFDFSNQYISLLTRFSINTIFKIFQNCQKYIARIFLFILQCDVVTSSGDKKPKVFSYNVVFEPNATQEDILQHSGIKNLIEMAVEGFNCTAFCYGQTGSGKTHTLTGPPRLVSKTNQFSFQFSFLSILTFF